MPITITRSILVVLIPGSIAVAPWLFWAAIQHERLATLYSHYTGAFNFIGLAVIIVVGSVLEGICTHQEVTWDREREEKYKVTDNWYEYLAQVCGPEPPGFRYIGRLVTGMYFELSMMWAAPILFTGLSAIMWSLQITYHGLWSMLAIFVAGASFSYFRWQAHCTHKVLCVTRLQLNERLRMFRGERGQRKKRG